MSLIRWNPWTDLDTFQHEVNRLFEAQNVERRQAQPPTRAWTPAVDILEEPERFVLKFELPEVRPEDVHIGLEGDTLTVKGERKFEHEEKQKGWHRIERAYGQFSRSFSLPNNVMADNISATAKDGVLRLELPKKPEAKQRRIAVKTPD